jgi:hypothetical protein
MSVGLSAQLRHYSNMTQRAYQNLINITTMHNQLSTDGEDYEWKRMKLPYGTCVPALASKVAT